MRETWNDFKATLSDSTTMTKREFLLTLAVCILGGIVFGMLASPRKSTTIGSNNGNNSGNRDGLGDFMDDEFADWEDKE